MFPGGATRGAWGLDRTTGQCKLFDCTLARESIHSHSRICLFKVMGCGGMSHDGKDGVGVLGRTVQATSQSCQAVYIRLSRASQQNAEAKV